MSQSAEVEVSRCRKFRDEALSKNPAVKFMFKHLKRGGCELSPSKVECRHCDGQLAGGFQDDGGILLCSNHLTTQSHTSNTLVHEAVHAFDACRAKVDWGNCVHHACSEIRAAALSGDCNFMREVFLRRNFGFAKQFQRCVKRRAELSVSLNPYCDGLAVCYPKGGRYPMTNVYSYPPASLLRRSREFIFFNCRHVQFTVVPMLSFGYTPSRLQRSREV